MSITVSDTSPIRALAHLGLCDVLEILYGEVLVPPAVAGELEHPTSAASPVSLAQFAFVRVQGPTDGAMVSELLQELDAGESEAIALAIEVKADLILIDERRGREAVVRRGLKSVGVLGVLLAAKDCGIIPAVRPLVDRLVTETQFHVSRPLYLEVMKRAGE